MARKSFLQSAKRFTKSTGSFIKKRAEIFDENLRRQEMEEERRRKMKTMTKIGKKKRKKKTKKR